MRTVGRGADCRGIKNCDLLMYLSWVLDIGVVTLGEQLKIMVWSSGKGAGPEIKL